MHEVDDALADVESFANNMKCDCCNTTDELRRRFGASGDESSHGWYTVCDTRYKNQAHMLRHYTRIGHLEATVAEGSELFSNGSRKR